MKISTKARYAITAMMDLALHENTKPVTLSDISQYQGISLSYLEQLFAKLRTNGLVRGVRGPGGGYRLSRSAAEITIADIVAAINEKEDIIFKEVNTARQEVLGERNKLTDMWSELSTRMHDFLSEITLQEFVADSQAGRTDRSAPKQGVKETRDSDEALTA